LFIELFTTGGFEKKENKSVIACTEKRKGGRRRREKGRGYGRGGFGMKGGGKSRELSFWRRCNAGWGL
jgi:hypothetical protein